MIKFLDLEKINNRYRTELEDRFKVILDKGWYLQGNENKIFSENFASYCGTQHCVGVANGLDALTLLIRASGFGPGDEIIVPSNTYIATILAISNNGCTPVLVEPDMDTYNIDVNKIEEKITSKTKAIMVVHLYGYAVAMDKVNEVAKRHNLKVFEDCAQSHFAPYKGVNTGLFGDASFFSFYPTKNLGGFGDGGGVISRNKELIDRVKVIRNYGSDYRYHNIVIGYNDRLDEMQAGLLRVKLSHMPVLLANRDHIAQRYLKEIKNPLVQLPETPKECKHTWYQFVVRVDNQDAFIEYLKAHDVATDIAWKTPPYLQPCMVEKFGYKRGDFPITEKICDSIVSLPMMDYMDEEEITKVINEVNSYAGV